MKKKGQRTFNNENVQRVKMSVNLFSTLHGFWTSFISAEKLLTARPLPKTPPQVRQKCLTSPSLSRPQKLSPTT